MDQVPEFIRPNRKVLLVISGVSAIASIVLFMMQPVPTVGLVAAVGAAVVSLLFLWQAFFPKHVVWINRKMERMTKTKDDPNEPARWLA